MTGSLVDRSQVERLFLLAAALQAGVIDTLAGMEAATAEAVAASIPADARACRLVLEALVDIGVVEVVNSAETAASPFYRLSEHGRRHLVDPGPELERSWLLHQAGKMRGWMDLPYIIAHGRRPPRSGRSRDLRTFACTMAEGDPAQIDEVVDLVLAYAGWADLSSPDQVGADLIDVGGGLGHVALRFVARGLRAAVFDTPEIISIAREHQAARKGGLSLVEGDFNTALPAGPFFIAYLGNVFHIYEPAKNRRLAARVFDSLRPGGVLAAVDYVWDRSPRARMFAIDMLQATDKGGVWTEAQYRSWLDEAGFEDVRIVDLTRGTNQLILGRRPLVRINEEVTDHAACSPGREHLLGRRYRLGCP